MRIMQVIDSLHTGGAERMCLNISQILTDYFHENIIVSSRESQPENSYDITNYNFFCLNKKNFFDLFAFIKFIKIVKRFKPDFIHAHSSSIFWTILIKLFFWKIKIIWHDHAGILSNESILRKYYSFFSFLYSGVIVVNDNLYQWACKNIKIDISFITMINNFAMIKTVYSNDKITNTVNLLCVANLCDNKNQLLVLKSLNNLIKKNYNINLTLIGKIIDTTYFSILKKYILDNKLTSNVEIITNSSSPFKFFEKIHISILCSKSEGLPVTILEYGLAEIPIIVSNVGDCSKVVKNGELGILLKSFDEEEIANSIIKIINNYSIYKKKALNLKQFIIKDYSSSSFYRKYNYLLNKINSKK